MVRIPILILIYCCLSSCEFKVETKTESDPPKEKAKSSYKRNKNKIRNGIEFATMGGIKVEQAYLTYGDDGSLVDDSNITAINRQIKLNLILDGWETTGDRVYLEASQKVRTDDGTLVLNETNLFEANGMESVSLAEAKMPLLNVWITKFDKLSDYFLVEFRIWSKKYDQAVEGRYKFHLDNM